MRLYNPDFKPFEATVLTPRQLHHLSVRRFRQNREALYVFNDKNGLWKVRFDRNNIIIPTEYVSPAIPTPTLGLAFGLIKSSHLSDFLEKAVELGVTDFFPLQTDFSQNYPLKIDKLEHVMVDAIQQSERMTLPKIHPLSSFKVFYERTQNFKLLSAVERNLIPTIFNINIQSQPPCIILGPEGGWSLNEKNNLMDKTHSFSLGEAILKVETAMVLSVGYCSLNR
jgi:16S rRNA (uracil1498-N3)-methyltransferase